MAKLSYCALPIALIAVAATALAQESTTEATIWQTLKDMPVWIGAVIGAAIAGIFGFISLAGAALLNAHLNRRRDDRLRRQESRALASALLSELLTIIPALVARKTAVDGFMNKLKKEPASRSWIYRTMNFPSLMVSVYQSSLDRLGLLPPIIGSDIVFLYGEIDTFIHDMNILETEENIRLSGIRTPFEVVTRDLVGMIKRAEVLAPKLKALADEP